MDDDLTQQNKELTENEIEKIKEQNQKNEDQNQRSQVFKVEHTVDYKLFSCLE